MERAANGYALRMIGTNVDITERKRAEDLMREANSAFATWLTPPANTFGKPMRIALPLPVQTRGIGAGPCDGKVAGSPPSEFMPPGEAERVGRWIAAQSVTGGGSQTSSMTVTDAGEIRWRVHQLQAGAGRGR